MNYSLTIDDLNNISSAEGVAKLFRQLGYDSAVNPLSVADLELSARSSNEIQAAYFLSHYKYRVNSLQVLLFKFDPREFSSYLMVRNRMEMIAKILCKRPSHYLLIATTDYKQLLLTSPRTFLNDQLNLEVKIAYCSINLSDPSTQDCRWLEKLGVKETAGDSLHVVHQQVLKNARTFRAAETETPPERDSIGAYLNEIGRIPLLDPREEIELARKIKRYHDLDRIRKQLTKELGRPPTNREWNAATDIPLLAFQVGQRAKKRLINANLRLVVSIAKRYLNRGVEFQDLIQEGNLGLIRATEKFKLELGNRFSTYATWWIRQAITRVISNHSRLIRLPVHVYEKYSDIKKTTKLLSQELKRSPRRSEIAEYADMEVSKLDNLLKSFQPIASLDIRIGDEENSTLGELIQSDHTTPADVVERRLRLENVAQLLSTLKEREAYILRERFGLGRNEPRSLESIGQELGLTRERVRQIEAKVLKKLRNENIRGGLFAEYSKPHNAPVDSSESVPEAIPEDTLAVHKLHEISANERSLMKDQLEKSWFAYRQYV
jgi:RNA polymerase sigma factor (sigma-70 family)